MERQFQFQKNLLGPLLSLALSLVITGVSTAQSPIKPSPPDQTTKELTNFKECVSKFDASVTWLNVLTRCYPINGARSLTRSLDTIDEIFDSEILSELVLTAGTLLEVPRQESFNRNLVSQWSLESKTEGALEALLAQLNPHAKSKLKRIADWPLQLKSSLYLVLIAQLNANQYVNQAQSQLSDSIIVEQKDIYDLLSLDGELTKDRRDKFHSEFNHSMKSFDNSAMFEASYQLIMAVSIAAENLKTITGDDRVRYVKFAYPTSYGLIVVHGIENDSHAYRVPLFLSIDLGGNDSYKEAGANDPSLQATSVSIDLGGNDIYQAPSNSRASFGSGTFGIGILWDESGDDRYFGSRRSQGSGYFGVGVLVDRDGDDHYYSTLESQGAGLSGVGILYDRKGNDEYESISFSQGLGAPGGVGLLYDESGDDQYTLGESSPVRFPASQDSTKNVSMGQGAGFGYRAGHLINGGSTGGIGFLIDRNGSDNYLATIFAQGTGYWYGTGVLADRAGNDRYQAYWYGQGVGAHFGSGILLDRIGDDQYLVEKQMGLGSGHHFGTGIMIDFNGSNRFSACTLCQGAENASGHALFMAPDFHPVAD